MRPTGPGQPAHLLLDVVDILNELAIPYAMVGALAVSYHGLPRHTNDADATVWLSGTGMTPKDLTDRLRSSGYRVTFNRGDIDDPVAAAMIVEDEHPNRIDLLLGVRGMDPEAVTRCISSLLLDSSIRIIGAEDLVAMKIFACGFQDLEDARGILQVSREGLNLDLLRKLSRRYGPAVADRLEELLHENPPTTP